MSSSYLNMITFLGTTLFYYLAIKPSYTYEISIDPTKQKEYKSSSYMYLAIYLLLVMVIQFMVNASIISSTCGGNITENMGAAGKRRENELLGMLEELRREMKQRIDQIVKLEQSEKLL